MEILNIIKKYLDERGYPADWRIIYGGYNGLRVEWTADNGAHCKMDAWQLLNEMVRYEFTKNNKELPHAPEQLIILSHQDT